ncbi:hypothetical protein [Streptomyces sp. AK02-04a]|uniref:hypothetical protein n=1 Tax=Streptomyces sp. AK02-04a TaxID=3028649 RepID=UPI0029C9FE86|nr:hypothetical protein [Streptomyces sp. AK02-04a]
MTRYAAGGGNSSARRPVCGARLPRRRAVRGTAAAGAGGSKGCRDELGWSLLPKLGWRRIDTIRVRRLFG